MTWQIFQVQVHDAGYILNVVVEAAALDGVVFGADIPDTGTAPETYDETDVADAATGHVVLKMVQIFQVQQLLDENATIQIEAEAGSTVEFFNGATPIGTATALNVSSTSPAN